MEVLSQGSKALLAHMGSAWGSLVTGAGALISWGGRDFSDCSLKGQQKPARVCFGAGFQPVPAFLWTGGLLAWRIQGLLSAFPGPPHLWKRDCVRDAGLVQVLV